jgi:DNA-binding response OmpR family regulator
LIVEDEAAHAAAIRRAFESSGTDAAIEVVGSLREFRERSASSPPDIAVMDLTLPDGRAVDVLTKQREDGAFPILIMTSLGNEQTAVDVLKAGAMDYVVKSPETFSALSLTVTRTLREWNLLLERERDTDRRQDCDAGGPV